MPTTAAAIDRLLQDGLELKLDDSYVTTEWRPRALFALQKAVAEAYLKFPSDMRYGTTNLSLVGPATDVDLPADFSKTGFKGGLRIPTSSKKVHYLPSDKFEDLSNAAGVGGGLGEPEFYTLSGLGTIAGRRKASFYPAPASGTTYTIRMKYEKSRPTLVDTTGATNLLDTLSDELFESVLYLGALDWLMFGTSDARSISEVSPRFREGLGTYISTVQAGQEELIQYGEEGVPELGMW